MSLFSRNPDDPSLATNFPFDLYRNDIRIKDKLKNKFLIINKHEFTEWFDPKQLRSSAQRKENLIVTLTTEVCREQIEGNYIKTSMNLNLYDPAYDLIVVVQSDYKTASLSSDQKLSKIVGFMITQLGECKMQPNVISVKLICIREHIDFKSYYLLGALMYCLKGRMVYKQRVILELADKYLNLAGFFAYTKVGFDRDDALYNKNCFKEIECLPMSVDLIKYTKDEIIQLATNNKVRNDVDDISGLYALGQLEDKNIQQKLAKYANWIFEIEVAKIEPSTTEYRNFMKELKNPKKFDYISRLKKLKAVYKKILTPLQPKVTMPVNYLDDADMLAMSGSIGGMRTKKKKKRKKRKTTKRRKGKK